MFTWNVVLDMFVSNTTSLEELLTSFEWIFFFVGLFVFVKMATIK